jgi:hypothetical protein
VPGQWFRFIQEGFQKLTGRGVDDGLDGGSDVPEERAVCATLWAGGALSQSEVRLCRTLGERLYAIK